MLPTERRNIINRLADLIEKNIPEIGALESLDNGKSFPMGCMDAGFGAEVLRYYSGFCDKIEGNVLPMRGNFFGYTRKEPVGVCVGIVPWNFPFLMSIFKVAPALAAGNTIILKPAENTPLTALKFAELVMEAGVPEGVVNILPGYGSIAGDALVKHRGVDKIAFTGSAEVGRNIIMNAGIKRVTLELGGKSPNIVLDDADLEKAVAWTNFGAYVNSGQFCMSGSRLFVQEGIYDKFMDKLVNQIK